jgi:hypothetical protein
LLRQERSGEDADQQERDQRQAGSSNVGRTRVVLGLQPTVALSVATQPADASVSRFGSRVRLISTVGRVPALILSPGHATSTRGGKWVSPETSLCSNNIVPRNSFRSSEYLKGPFDRVRAPCPSLRVSYRVLVHTTSHCGRHCGHHVRSLYMMSTLAMGPIRTGTSRARGDTTTWSFEV